MRKFGTLPLVLAGFCVLALAWHLINSSVQSDDPAFMAYDVEDYAGQRIFYNGGIVVEEGEKVDKNEAVRAVHAAASAKEKEDIINIAGFVLVIFALWYLHHEHDLFLLSDKPKFKVRRIK